MPAMVAGMATLTDPARELAVIATKLAQGSNSKGDEFLAQQFGVVVWSTDFVRIIACIMDRADLVGRVIAQSDMDEDHRASAAMDLEGFKSAFAMPSLKTAWNTAGAGISLVQNHGHPLKYLSHTVRKEVSYPTLSPDEIKEFISLIDAYLIELRKSDEGPSFVRQAINDGLLSFRFQLVNLEWVGAAYSLIALRELMLVNDAAQQHFDMSNPDPDSFLRGLGAFIGVVKSRLDSAKGYADAGELVWKAYSIGTKIAVPLMLSGKYLALPAPG